MDPKDIDIQRNTRGLWRIVWLLLGTVLVIGGAIAAALLSGHADLVENFWSQVIVSAVVVVLIAVAFVGLAKYHSIPSPLSDPLSARRHIDRYQRRWRWTLLLAIFVIAQFAWNGMHSLPGIAPGHRPWALLFGGSVAGIALFYAYVLSFGPGWLGLIHPGVSQVLDDEFAQALRTRVMRFGYLFAMALLGAALLITLWEPAAVVPALSIALVAGFAGPALYYIIADWRAAREN